MWNKVPKETWLKIVKSFEWIKRTIKFLTRYLFDGYSDLSIKRQRRNDQRQGSSKPYGQPSKILLISCSTTNLQVNAQRVRKDQLVCIKLRWIFLIDDATLELPPKCKIQRRLMKRGKKTSLRDCRGCDRWSSVSKAFPSSASWLCLFWCSPRLLYHQRLRDSW